MSLSQYAIQDYSNNNIYYINQSTTINSNLTVPINNYLIIPKDYTLTISPNIIINNSGALINYGTIDISLNAAITNTSSGIILNEFSGTIINDSSNNSNTNSGKIINRGSYSNELISSTFTNGSGGIFLNKNGGTFDNTGLVINEPGGVFENYYNYLRVNNGGQVVNYGQYINDIIYEPGTTIIPPYSLIAAGSNHSLGLQYGVSGELYAWGNNISGQLGNDDALYDISSSTPILVLNGQEYIQSPQILANTVQYHYAIRTSNIITSSSTPTSSNILDISVNSLSLTFSEYGYWDISGSIVTIYGIQGNFSDISYSSIFQGGNCNLLGLVTNVINSISSSTNNPLDTSYNLILTISPFSENFINNGGYTVILSSNPTYPSASNFLSNVSTKTLTLPNTITTDPSFTVIIPQDQNYTLPSYTYNSLSSPTNPIFSFFSDSYSSYPASTTSSYTINVGNNNFNLNQLYNYDISYATGNTMNIIISPNGAISTIYEYEYDISNLSLFIAVDNLLIDAFPYLSGVTLTYVTSIPATNTVILNITSGSIKISNNTKLLQLVVNTATTSTPITTIVNDISNNPLMTYTLTTTSLLKLNTPITIQTNPVANNVFSITIDPSNNINNSYSYTTFPKGITGYSTFQINTPVNLIAPTTPFQGYFNADFSFNISYNVSPAPASDLCGNQWISVASGGNTSFGLRDGGYLYAWGDNTYGHLGTGDVVDTSQNYPTKVDLSNCIAVNSGLNHALALDSSNNAWAWGDNTYGQLGDGGIDTSSNIPVSIIFNNYKTFTTSSTSPQPYTIMNPNTTFITVGIAGGYGGNGNNGNVGGYGAFVTVPNIPVNLGQTIYFDIGGNGGNIFGSPAGAGGAGILDPNWSITTILTGGPGLNGGGGGAGSLVYIDNNTNLIAVAGGGGGAFYEDNGGNAGIGINGNGTGVGGGNGTNFTVGGIGGSYTGIEGGGGGGGYGAGGGGVVGFPTQAGIGGGGNGENGQWNDEESATGGAGGSYINPKYNTEYATYIVSNNAPPADPSFSYIQENSSIDTISSTTAKFTYVNTGDNHSLAIDFSNNLFTWGNNSFGQLGVGSTPDTSRNYPSFVQNPNPSPTKWLKAVGGSNHSLGLQSDGSLWAWGDNTYGQLGNGQSGLDMSSNVPISVTNLFPSNIRWVDIAAGANVSMAITNMNQLYAWGSDISGQIGIVNPPYTTPQLISSSLNFIKCAIGGSHSLGININDSNLYAWGINTYGQLGIGTDISHNTPQEVIAPLNPILTF